MVRFLPVGFYRPLDEGSGSKQIQTVVCKWNVLGEEFRKQLNQGKLYAIKPAAHDHN